MRGTESTLAESKLAAVKACSEAISAPSLTKVNKPGWTFDVPAEAPTPSPEPENLAKAISLQEHNDPTWVLAQHGFKFGVIVFGKISGANPASNLFCITSVGETVILSQVCSYSAQAMVANVDAEVLIAKWDV